MTGKFMANRCLSSAPGCDPKDWRNTLNIRSLRIVDLAVKLNIWEPDMPDGGEE